MKTNIKMRVTPEQSKKVQEIVFANGGIISEELSGREFLFLWDDFELVFGYEEEFEEEDEQFEEVDADLFILTNGTCEE